MTYNKYQVRREYYWGIGSTTIHPFQTLEGAEDFLKWQKPNHAYYFRLVGIDATGEHHTIRDKEDSHLVASRQRTKAKSEPCAFCGK